MQTEMSAQERISALNKSLLNLYMERDNINEQLATVNAQIHATRGLIGGAVLGANAERARQEKANKELIESLKADAEAGGSCGSPGLTD